MALVFMGSHGWGTLFIDPADLEAGVGLQSSFTNPADATAATHYADADGNSPSTGPVTADANGRLLRWIEEGTYNQELPGGTTLEVEAVSGSTLASVETRVSVQEDVWIDIRSNGSDDTADWLAAVAEAGNGKKIRTKSEVLYVNDSDVMGRRVTVEGGGSSWSTRIEYTGTTVALFELGTDNGHAHDANEYDGMDGLTLRKIEIKGMGATALDNGIGGLTYLPGSCGIRDWRGGDMRFDDVRISGFDDGIWGIQSDINSFHDVEFNGNHRAVYLGPRSDQARFTGACNFIFNDIAIELDSAFDAQFQGTIFVDNGAVGQNPIVLRSTFSRKCQEILFNGCWFEHLIGLPELEAYIDAGVGDTNLGDGLVIRNSMFLCNPLAGAHHMKYVVKLDRFDNVEIDTFTDPFGGHESLIRKVGTLAPQIRLRMSRAQANLASSGVSLAGGATAAKTTRLDLGDAILGVGDGTTGRAPIQLLGDPAFPVIQFVDAAGAIYWKITNQVSSAGQMWTDAPSSTAQWHLRDDTATDAILYQPLAGLKLGGTKAGVEIPAERSTWSGSTVRAETMSRLNASAANALVNGTIHLTYFTARKALTIGKLAFSTRGTAQTTATLVRYGLYLVNADASLTLVARTANDTTLLNSTFTYTEKALDTTGGFPATYALLTGREYAIAVIHVGTTVAAVLYGASLPGGSIQPFICAQVTGRTDLDTTINALGGSAPAVAVASGAMWATAAA